MSQIDIRHPHQLTPAAARQLVETLADGLARKFQAVSHWDGDRLHFQRSGIDGHIEVGADFIRVSARLGLLLAAMRPLIEREVEAELKRRLQIEPPDHAP
ncbi:MAG TPA: polyhydroxyalkanoic acid system family protein [Rhodanobacteraceae bacterium]|nr:polyhydroxyalkanoic acid system family protein [Rhodanobacteraceae bacterium]